MDFDYKRELQRKSFHLLSLFYVFIFYIFFPYNSKLGLFILTAILLFLIQVEFFRLELKKEIPIISSIYRRIARRKEKNQLASLVFTTIGIILTFAIFDVRIATAAVLMMIFGDAIAAIVDKKFGKHKIPRFENRSFEGFFSQLIVNLIIGIIFVKASYSLVPLFSFVKATSFSGAIIWPAALIMAFTATFVETVTRKIDDNLLIPLFAGFNGQLILIILNLFR